MNTTTAVALACAHQSDITQWLAVAGATMPVASVLAWVTARWKAMPLGAQALLQFLAGNVMHSLLGEPTPPPPPPAPGAKDPPVVAVAQAPAAQ